MTPKVQKMLEFLKAKEYREKRAKGKVDVSHLCLGLDEYDESLILLREALSSEALVLYDGDIFAFNKSRSGYYVNANPNRRSYRANNITVNFGRVIDSGFDKIAEDIYLLKASANEEQKRYYTILLDIK